VTYVIAEPCVDVLDRSCVDACPVDCIYEGGRMAFIQPDECVDCGACVQVCPVEAIYYEDDLPEEWFAFTAINAAYFEGVGSPGGTANLPKGTVPDPAEVTALPARSPEA
jgi:NAD-dependent dihydropyrimidine dehydrogenase PreA subunit